MNFELNEETFLIYAIKHYDNPSCSGMKEFLDDLKAFKYLTRLFRRYKQRDDLKERLIINHLVVLYNIFGAEASTHMLFHKINKDYWPVLKTFLIYLKYVAPEEMPLITIDSKVADVLRKI